MTTPIEKVNRISTASVLASTGKTWDQWVAILDRAGARGWPHREIVAYLRTKYSLRPWWQQGVASGYEIVIGRKVEGRSARGDFSCNVSRTLPIGSAAAWKLLFSEVGLEAWLKPLTDFRLKPNSPYEAKNGVFGEVRTFKVGERLRFTWQEDDWEKPSIVQVSLIPRAKGKCVVVFQHDRIADTRKQEDLRSHWTTALTEIAGLIPELSSSRR